LKKLKIFSKKYRGNTQKLTYLPCMQEDTLKNEFFANFTFVPNFLWLLSEAKSLSSLFWNWQAEFGEDFFHILPDPLSVFL